MSKRRFISPAVIRPSFLPRDLNVHLLKFLELHEICAIRSVSTHFFRQCNSTLPLIKHISNRKAKHRVRFKLHILRVASTHCINLRTIGEFNFGHNPSEQSRRLLSRHFSAILQRNPHLSKIDTRIPGHTFCKLRRNPDFRLPALRSLFVSVNTDQQDSALAQICPNITRFHVSQPNFEQIVAKCLKLEELVVDRCRTLTLPPLNHIKLRVLQMPDTQLTDAQCAMMARNLGSAIELSFDATQITTEGMRLLALGATSLQELFLSGMCDEDILKEVFREEDKFPRLQCLWSVCAGVLRDFFLEFRPKCAVIFL
eukprot:244809_1